MGSRMMTHFMVTRFVHAWGSTALTLATAMFVLAPEPGQAQVGTEYGSRSACERAARLTAEQCANAFANAQAEWDEAMPRFPKREECAKRFGRCQIADMRRGRPSFQPVMDKVTVLNRGSNVTVVPVAPASTRGVATFSERSVLQKRTERSERKQAEAQKRWEAHWAAAEAAGAAPPDETATQGFTPEKPEAFDPNWQKQEGVRTYPAPAHRVRKPQS